MRIGVIADTHGLLRAAAVDALRGCDRIVHAGDVGDPAILAALSQLAPLTAVRGNNDHGPWAQALPETARLPVGRAWVYVLHDLGQLAIDPVAEGVAVVVAGHSHRPRADSRDGVLYLNPGSAGPRRFRLPVTVGALTVDDDGRIAAELIALSAGSG